MRIHLKILAENKIIPFDHQPYLTGVIHKWLGWNEWHDDISLYSFSQLEGGKMAGNGLLFENGAYFFFSAHDKCIIKKLINGIQISPELFHGLRVSEIDLQEDPVFLNRQLFFSASPILIKRKIGDNIEHIIYNDNRANSYLRETLLSKMERIGISDESVQIYFDDKYPNAKTRLITYKGIQNKTSSCPVVIEGKPETLLFAWNVGLGNSTGIGFGAIK